jgi:ribonucleoside-diphosphate reductase alpha chain
MPASFSLNKPTTDHLATLTPAFGFGGFGELVYYRTYSRHRKTGGQESWADTVIRVIEGAFTIRQRHYQENKLPFDTAFHQTLASEMAFAMFEMKWLPPGRGLWAMGTEYVFERGSAALQNCGATTTEDLALAADWCMDMLMCGVGVGWDTSWNGKVNRSEIGESETFVIPDSREGWVASVRALVEYWTTGGRPYPEFDYSLIRPAGAVIKGFGGTASGYQPLKQLHDRINLTFASYLTDMIDKTRTVADVMNAIGACVVAGNVRRSAQIALGGIDDDTFLNLKNYDRFPDRMDIGWMSNNSVVLKHHKDFENLPAIAERIRDNGEPGLINLLNVQRYGRLGEEMPDAATLFNPCAEQPLEDKELCTLVEVFPSRCKNKAEFERSLYYATWYASTVTLLPTHRPETNAVMQRNRRIGVSISGVTEALAKFGAAGLTRALRDGYKIVRKTNKDLARASGTPESIRVTTIKPSGSISQLAGCSPGAHFPTFNHAIRRIRVGKDTTVGQFLATSGLPHEDDAYSANTYVFEFPIKCELARPAKEVSAWEQFALLTMLQREWSDNAVSQTIYFDQEKEGPQVEHMLAQFAPLVKSVSMLPHSDAGAYKQMPYEGITRAQYRETRNAMPVIDWNQFTGSDGQDSRFCTNDTCTA